MQDGRVARRYAKALFGAAKGADLVRGVEEDLDIIVKQMKLDPTFKHFILAPYMSREEKAKILTKIFSDRVTSLTMQALRVILDKGREAELEAIFHAYVALRRNDAGIVYATIHSAVLIDEAQKKSLIAALMKSLGKTVEAEFKIDTTLIGGVKVTYENFVLDGSALGAIEKMRERLRYDLLKQV